MFRLRSSHLSGNWTTTARMRRSATGPAPADLGRLLGRRVRSIALAVIPLGNTLCRRVFDRNGMPMPIAVVKDVIGRVRLGLRFVQIQAIQTELALDHDRPVIEHTPHNTRVDNRTMFITIHDQILGIWRRVSACNRCPSESTPHIVPEAETGCC